MTGGVREEFNLKNLNESMKKSHWDILNHAHRKQSIMSCSIYADPAVKEMRLFNGLVKGHAYTITNFVIVKSSRFYSIRLIRIRNLWG